MDKHGKIRSGDTNENTYHAFHQNNMADLPSLLLASLNPDTRKQAEKNLTVLSSHQGFLVHLLNLILEPSQDRAVRLSGSVYLKNITKLRWEEVSLISCYLIFLALQK